MTKRRIKKEKINKTPNANAFFKFTLIFLLEIFLIVLILCGFCFYWYKWRPSQIVSICANHAVEKAIAKNENEGGQEGGFKARDREQYYEWCLQENGLEN